MVNCFWEAWLTNIPGENMREELNVTSIENQRRELVRVAEKCPDHVVNGMWDRLYALSHQRGPEEIERPIIDQLSGIPIDDVTALARVLARIGKRLNADFSVEDFMILFAGVWDDTTKQFDMSAAISHRHSGL